MRKNHAGKGTLILATVLVVALLAGQAQAVQSWGLITDGGFDATASPIPYAVFSVGSPPQWLAGGSGTWTIGMEPGNKFAQHTGAGSELLIQGVPAPESKCGDIAGFKVKLSFKYQSTTGAGTVLLYGFNTGGTWDPANGNFTNGQELTKITSLPMTPTTGDLWGTFQTSMLLPSLSSGLPYAALGVGFNLPAVDDVVLEVVVPVSFKLTPRTLNLKSKGNWVTGFISNPSSCYTLADINIERVNGDIPIFLAPEGGEPFAVDWINNHGKKFMCKFSRMALITAIGDTVGQVKVFVTGTFTDGIAFEGETSIRVINPGKKK